MTSCALSAHDMARINKVPPVDDPCPVQTQGWLGQRDLHGPSDICEWTRLLTVSDLVDRHIAAMRKAGKPPRKPALDT